MSDNSRPSEYGGEMNKPTLLDLKEGAEKLADACNTSNNNDIENAIGSLRFIETRLILAGTLRFESIFDAERKLVKEL